MRADLYRLGLASALGLALAAFGSLAPAWLATFGLGVCAGLGLAVLVPDFELALRGAYGRLTRGRQAGARETATRTIRAAVRAPILGANPVWPKPPNFASLARHAGSLFSFLWRWKKAILVLIVFFWLSAMVHSCTPWGKSKGELSRERDRARAELEASREMTRVIVPIVAQAHETRARIEAAHERARETLEAIPRETSETDFLLAWARADRSLLDAGRPA